MPTVRARDLRVNIKEMGFENGVVHTLELLLDEYAETRQHLQQAVEMLARCVDTIEKLTHAGNGMRRLIEQMERDRTGGENDPSDIQNGN